MNITVVGTGYVGLSVAVLLSQHHDVHAIDFKVYTRDLLNRD